MASRAPATPHLTGGNSGKGSAALERAKALRLNRWGRMIYRL
jgi:hypothetical protein